MMRASSVIMSFVWCVSSRGLGAELACRAAILQAPAKVCAKSLIGWYGRSCLPLRPHGQKLSLLASNFKQFE
eukprot:4433660-Amphidinium_carterae.1